MGGLFSRTIVVDLTHQYSTELRQIEASVAELQARKQAQLSRQRQLSRALVLYGSMIWLLLAATLYLIDLPNRTHFVAKCVRIGPLIGWPVGLFLIAKLIDSYYTIQFRKTDATLAKLEKSKETKLEELMARTHFKETQQLISHFSEKKPPRQQGQQGQQQNQTGGQQSQQHAQQHSTPHKMQQGAPGQMGRQAPASAKHAAQTMPASAFKAAQQQQQQQQQQHQQQQNPMQQQSHAASMQPGAMNPQSLRGGMPAPAAVVANSATPGARSSLDKVLDFILNDGPNNRFALICPQCYGHNGLVQEAELGKIRYRCAMCGAINGPPPTAQMQQAQQLHYQQQMQAQAQQLQAQQMQAAVGGASSAVHPPLSPSGPAAPTTPAHAASSSSGVSHSSSIPLTPFAPLPPTDEEEEEEASMASVTRRLSGAAPSGMAQQDDDDGAVFTSRSRRNSRVGGQAPRMQLDEGEEEESEAAPVEAEAAPGEKLRQRKSQRAK